MADEILISHRHPDGDQPMSAVGEQRIDGLRVRQFSCDCGFGAAILSRVEEMEPGVSWPFAFGRPREIA
jgi:hypothetical protein